MGNDHNLLFLPCPNHAPAALKISAEDNYPLTSPRFYLCFSIFTL